MNERISTALRGREWLIRLCLAAMTLSLAASAQAGAGIKHRVIVGDFEMKAEAGWYHGPKPGAGMADMLTTALMQSDQFRVYERAALDELLAERNLSVSNLADPSGEVTGMIEIADILVKGVITEFGYKESKIGGGIAKLGGRAGVKNYEGRVAVDLRVISVGTGEVLWADTVADSESSKSLSMSNSDFSFGDQKSYDETVVGKATRKVINRIVEELGNQTRKLPWSGILITADDLLFIDAGSEIGLSPGMEFTVRRMTKEVKHPKTGKILKRVYADVGVLKATEVEEGVTTVVAVSGSGFETGDMITLK